LFLNLNSFHIKSWPRALSLSLSFSPSPLSPAHHHIPPPGPVTREWNNFCPSRAIRHWTMHRKRVGSLLDDAQAAIRDAEEARRGWLGAMQPCDCLKSEFRFLSRTRLSYRKRVRQRAVSRRRRGAEEHPHLREREGVRVCVCVCVCVCVRERGGERECVCVCVCEREGAGPPRTSAPSTPTPPGTGR